MCAFDSKAFDSFIIEHGVIGFFEKPITLKSGRESSWYVNWRTVAQDAFLLDRLSDFVIAFVKTLWHEKTLAKEPSCFFGVPEGASKVALITQLKWAKLSPNYTVGSHAVAMGRGKIKEHGELKDRCFLGVPKGPTIVLEDVTTTGGSLLETIDLLNEAQVEILCAISLTSRGERRSDGKLVDQAIAEKSSRGRPVQYFCMSHAQNLLKLALDAQKPSATVRAKIEAECLT